MLIAMRIDSTDEDGGRGCVATRLLDTPIDCMYS
jgi:hypothetical protein